MAFLVRHLQPTETGIPIEIYVFSKVKEINEYENIQADIFDHILAIIPEFELRVFQSPSGNDIRDLSENLSAGIIKN
jgi:miniconductance mechanosensitive channel